MSIGLESLNLKDASSSVKANPGEKIMSASNKTMNRRACTTYYLYDYVPYGCSSGNHMPGDPACIWNDPFTSVPAGEYRAGYHVIPRSYQICEDGVQSPVGSSGGGGGGADGDTSPYTPGNYNPCDEPPLDGSTRKKKTPCDNSPSPDEVEQIMASALLIKMLNISDSRILQFINDPANAAIVNNFLAYVGTNGKTPENIEFLSWAVGYLNDNISFYGSIKSFLLTDLSSVAASNITKFKKSIMLAKDAYEFEKKIENDSFDAVESEWLNTLRVEEARLEELTNSPVQIRQYTIAVIDASLVNGIRKTAKHIWPSVNGATTTYSSKLSEFNTNADHGASILLWEFANGIGEDVWNFTYNQDVCQKFLSGRVLQEVKSDFYKLIDEKKLSYSDFQALSDPLSSGLEFSPDHTNILDSFSKHVNSNWIQFVIGGANIRYSPSDEDGWIEVRIFNNMSRKSLLLHSAESYIRTGDHNNKRLSTTQQNFKFLMQIDKTKFH